MLFLLNDNKKLFINVWNNILSFPVFPAPQFFIFTAQKFQTSETSSKGKVYHQYYLRQICSIQNFVT